jgi:hypothetical protein
LIDGVRSRKKKKNRWLLGLTGNARFLLSTHLLLLQATVNLRAFHEYICSMHGGLEIRLDEEMDMGRFY